MDDIRFISFKQGSSAGDPENPDYSNEIWHVVDQLSGKASYCIKLRKRQHPLIITVIYRFKENQIFPEVDHQAIFNQGHTVGEVRMMIELEALKCENSLKQDYPAYEVISIKTVLKNYVE